MKPAPGRSPEFRLIKALRISSEKELPAGCFVKPIRLEYLSAERRDEFKYHDTKTESICWTPLGFMRIAKNLIEEIP